MNEMANTIGVVFVGLNGAGKSTLAKYVGKKLEFDVLEVEDFWFETPCDYQNPRKSPEVSQLMLDTIEQSSNGFIIAGNISNLSKKIEAYLSLVVYVDVAKEVRVQRVIQREKNRYGFLEKGTDLYNERQDFLTFVQARTPDTIFSWIERTNIPMLKIDGTNTFEQNTSIIQQKLLTLSYSTEMK